MKTLTISMALIFTVSCTNIQHLTNSNLSDLQGLSMNQALRMKYDSVKEIKAEETTSCKSIGNFEAKDNALDTGEKFALLYLKAMVLEAKGNSVVVKSQEKVGSYGNIARGEGFSCP